MWVPNLETLAWAFIIVWGPGVLAYALVGIVLAERRARREQAGR